MARRGRMIIASLAIAAFVNAAPASAQSQNDKPKGKDTPPIVKMDDGFEYALLDFGYGRVRIQPPAKKPPDRRVLWAKVRITNLSKSQISSPQFWRFTDPVPYPPSDNFGNTYPAATQSLKAVTAPSGRYKPGESSIQLLTIAGAELPANINELRISLGESGFLGLHQFFALAQPTARERDFDPDRPDPPHESVPARARRTVPPAKPK